MMTFNNCCFYFQNKLIQTSQTGGQQYSDTSPFSIPCKTILLQTSWGDTSKPMQLMHAVTSLAKNRASLKVIKWPIKQFCENCPMIIFTFYNQLITIFQIMFY